MTGEIVNLNRARKAKIRAEKAKRAESNRATHGRSKAEKTRQREEAGRKAAELDGKHLDDDPPDGT